MQGLEAAPAIGRRRVQHRDLGSLISMAAAAYGWLRQRIPGLSAETLASATTLKILAGVVVLAVEVFLARSQALRARFLRALHKIKAANVRLDQ